MSTSEPKYYYLKHPDHLYRFIHWFAPIPEKKTKPQKYYFDVNLKYDGLSSVFGGWIIIGIILMLFSWFKLYSIILTLIPICILIILFIYEYIAGYIEFLFDRKNADRLNKKLPYKLLEWKNQLCERYSNYEKYITSKFKYRYNPETQKGRTARLLQNSLKKVGVPVKIEAELMWKGINLLPTTPYRGSNSKTWFNQFKYTSDFVYVNSGTGVMLDIEIDEDYHFSNEVQKRKDLFRNTVFLCNGWSVIRFKDTEILNNSIECANDVKNVIKQIEDIHKLIKGKLRNISTADLSDFDYSDKKFCRWVWQGIKKDNPELIERIDFDSIEQVDYSDNQLMNYLEDWYKKFK